LIKVKIYFWLKSYQNHLCYSEEFVVCRIKTFCSSKIIKCSNSLDILLDKKDDFDKISINVTEIHMLWYFKLKILCYQFCAKNKVKLKVKVGCIIF